MKYNLSNVESKELFLMEIEGTSTWRTSVFERFPNDKMHNLEASAQLMQLYDSVETLPKEDILFNLIGNPDISVIVQINIRLKFYRCQDRSKPHDFFNSLRRMLMQAVMNDEIFDN